MTDDQAQKPSYQPQAPNYDPQAPDYNPQKPDAQPREAGDAEDRLEKLKTLLNFSDDGYWEQYKNGYKQANFDLGGMISAREILLEAERDALNQNYDQLLASRRQIANENVALSARVAELERQKQAAGHDKILSQLSAAKARAEDMRCQLSVQTDELVSANQRISEMQRKWNAEVEEYEKSEQRLVAALEDVKRELRDVQTPSNTIARKCYDLAEAALKEHKGGA